MYVISSLIFFIKQTAAKEPKSKKTDQNITFLSQLCAHPL